MPDAPQAPIAYDFAVICTDAIFIEKISRQSRGEPFVKSDVVRIIREQDALRLDRVLQKATSAPFGNRKHIPPTAEQVAAYSAKIGYPMDGEKWCDFYAAKGWMVGKSRMKDWQAAVRNWKTNGWGQGTIVLCATSAKHADTTQGYTRF